MLFLIQFAHHHPRFRLPELQSIISLLRISATFDMDAYSLDVSSRLVEIIVEIPPVAFHAYRITFVD